MLDFLFASDNVPFMFACAVLVLLLVLQLISLVMGFGVETPLDMAIPDLDLPTEIHVDGGNLEAVSGPLRALTWLGLGRVPVVILIGLYLTFFAAVGLALQGMVFSLTGQRYMLPFWLAWIPALAATVPLARYASMGIARIMPREETTAVSSRTFIGRVAIIITGTARSGSPAEAKLHDEHGQVHYLLVEPDVQTDEFTQGTDVLIVSQNGATFRGIRNQSAAMVD
jgi:hypothetical protein